MAENKVDTSVEIGKLINELEDLKKSKNKIVEAVAGSLFVITIIFFSAYTDFDMKKIGGFLAVCMVSLLVFFRIFQIDKKVNLIINVLIISIKDYHEK
jgi:hypothetical protein